jgi:hypothetical protein
MGQRKLTDFEQRLVYDAWNAMGKLHCQVQPEIYRTLCGMRDFGTTDGKPYVEPEPEIGEGYRVATFEDRDGTRSDVDYWDRTLSDWVRVPKVDIVGSMYYRVPVDRIPTDDDARERPLVMVRDTDTQEWRARTLIAVDSGSSSPFYTTNCEGVVVHWIQCRSPYPGE